MALDCFSYKKKKLQKIPQKQYCKPPPPLPPFEQNKTDHQKLWTSCNDETDTLYVYIV